MKFFRLLSFILLVFTMPAAAAPLTDLSEAESQYRQGNYEPAANIYQSLLRQGLAGGELYYNLGNCYYKMGQYGLAILNYERAERDLGKDPDLVKNQKLAQLKAPDKIQPLPRWFVIQILEGIRGAISLGGWARWFILFEWFLAGCLVALVAFPDLAIRPWLTRLFWGCAVLFIVTGSFFFASYYTQSRNVEGIILASSVEIRSAPDKNSTELFTLHEGAKIRVLRRLPGWAEILLADGKQGWTRQEAFEMI